MPAAPPLVDTLAALATRHRLPPGAAGQLERLHACLAALAAPSTVPSERIVDDHLADALIALELAEVRSARRIADLGSGAGVPGLVLAIALPEAEVTLIESNGRKCEFIAASASACGLGNVSVAHARAEEWAAAHPSEADSLPRLRYELVTARALAALPVVAEYAAPLLREGGALVAWRGQIDPIEERAAELAAAELGLAYLPPMAVQPYPDARHRHLQVLRKVAPTPERFPRRPGMARKRPLGGRFGAPSDRRQR